MLRREDRAQLRYLGGAELDDATAAATHHVIVRVLAVGVLVVDLLVGEVHLANNAAFNEEFKSSVNGRLADTPRGLAHDEQQLLGLKMFLHAHRGAEDVATLARVLQSTVAAILAKNVLRCVDCFSRDGSGHV